MIRIHTICDRLAFGVEAELFEQALDDVAKVIGISSSRPEKTIGRGPDCLWLGPDGTFCVIEAKDEVELIRGELHKSETEQLLHSLSNGSSKNIPARPLVRSSSIQRRQPHTPLSFRVTVVSLLPRFWTSSPLPCAALHSQLLISPNPNSLRSSSINNWKRIGCSLTVAGVQRRKWSNKSITTESLWTQFARCLKFPYGTGRRDDRTELKAIHFTLFM